MPHRPATTKRIEQMQREGWIPSDKRPIQPGALTRCFACKTKLRSAQAHNVINPETLDVRPLGPTCFEDVTHTKPSALPTIGSYNTTPHGLAVAEHFSRLGRNIDLPKIRKREAISIVKARASLHAAGFDHMRENDLQNYRADANLDRLSETDVAAILAYDERQTQFDKRHGIAQLRACKTVDNQIKGLLYPERFPPETVNRLRHFQSRLQNYHVLICDDMAQLQRLAKEGEQRFRVPNQIKALAWPVKVDRYEPLIFPPEQRPRRRRGAPGSNSGQQSFDQMNLGIVLRPLAGLDPVR